MEKTMMGSWKVCAVIFMTSFLVLGESLLSVRPLAAQAQAITASLGGVVYDNTGATVPGAKVTLSDAEKGIARTFVTATNGRYFFGLVPAGTYSLKIEKPGFSTSLQERIVLGLGAAETLDATLQTRRDNTSCHGDVHGANPHHRGRQYSDRRHTTPSCRASTQSAPAFLFGIS